MNGLNQFFSNCRGAKHDPDSRGFTYHTVKHTTHLVDPDTRDHKYHPDNVAQCQDVPPSVQQGEDYHYHLPDYMFVARCKAQGIPPFLQFLHPIVNTDWTQCNVPHSSAHGTIIQLWSAPYSSISYYSYGRSSIVCYRVYSVTSHYLPTVMEITLSLMICAGGHMESKTLQSTHHTDHWCTVREWWRRNLCGRITSGIRRIIRIQNTTRGICRMVLIINIRTSWWTLTMVQNVYTALAQWYYITHTPAFCRIAPPAEYDYEAPPARYDYGTPPKNTVNGAIRIFTDLRHMSSQIFQEFITSPTPLFN